MTLQFPPQGWYRRFITGRGSAAGAGDWDLPDSAHDLGPYYPGLHLRLVGMVAWLFWLGRHTS
jgi:hypothetical protein